MKKALMNALTQTFKWIAWSCFWLFTCINLIIILFAFEDASFLKTNENATIITNSIGFAYLVLTLLAVFFKKLMIRIQVSKQLKVAINCPLLIVILIGVSFTFWFAIKEPSKDENWSISCLKMPHGIHENGSITLHHIRDFKYTTPDSFIAQWKMRQFKLDDIIGCDWLVSHWSGDAIAHTMLAFKFKNATPLVVSIETRSLKNKEQSMIAGLFKKVNIIWIIGTENDIVRLRTDYRKEDLYLYPICITPKAAQNAFLTILNKVNQLQKEPEFYNPLFHNCTTSYLSLLPRKNMLNDIRLLINGYSDEMGYNNRGFSDIQENESFIVYRAKHLTNLKLENQIVTDSNFSELIRRPFRLK